MTWRNYIRFVVHLADALAVCPTFVLMLCRLCLTEWNWESEANDCRHGGESTIPKRWKTTWRQRSARKLSNEGKFEGLGRPTAPNTVAIHPNLTELLHRYRKWSTCRSNNMSPSRALIIPMHGLWLWNSSMWY